MNGVPPRVPAQRTPRSDTSPEPPGCTGQSAIDEYKSWRQTFLLPRMEGRVRTPTAK